MFGAITGDIIGSIYEWNNVKTTNFPLFTPQSTFTDDTVLTIATADALLHQQSYTHVYQTYGNKYWARGYGSNFKKWLRAVDPQPYNSWGNGSAMRVSPIAWCFDDMEKVLQEAKKSASVTHNHPEGIKGAQATAAAILMARKGEGKAAIKTYIQKEFNYDLEREVAAIRPSYRFDVSCQGSVPEAIIAFLESTDFEQAIRLAISLGGDSDTIACITGSIAEAFYGGVPDHLAQEVDQRLDEDLLAVLTAFQKAKMGVSK